MSKNLPFFIGLEKLPYKTNRVFGNYSAGTSCLAFRDKDCILNLEFSRGHTYKLPGFYAYGLEFGSFENFAMNTIYDRMHKEIQTQMDHEIINEIF